MKISLATLAFRPYITLSDFDRHIDSCALQASAAGSQLLLLPELTCVGLLWGHPGASKARIEDIGQLYRSVLTPLLPSYREILSAIAVRRNIVVAGATFWHESCCGGLNTGFVAWPDGRVLTQDKLHPTRPEKAIGTSGGSNVAVFSVNGVSAALLICYDLQFPELTRYVVDQGVELLLVPSLTTERGAWRIRHAAHARAVENQIFVCVSPMVGNLGIPAEQPLTAVGGSFVACPIDNRFIVVDGTYVRAEDNLESVIHITLDFVKLRLSRQRSEIQHLADRRPDLYANLK